MAQESLNVGGGSGYLSEYGSGPNSQNYSVGGTQFVGGAANPDTAPPPAIPTTQLGNINPPAKTNYGPIGSAAGSYVGGAVGGSVGSAVGGGASIGSAVGNTLSNLGNTLKTPLGFGTAGTGTAGTTGVASSTPTSAASTNALESSTAPLGQTGNAAGAVPTLGDAGASQGLSTGGTSITDTLSNAANTASSASTLAGAAGAGVGAGALSELLGAATTPGSFVKNLAKPSVYQPAIENTIGTAAGSIIGSVVGGPIGAAIGGAIGGGLATLLQRPLHSVGTDISTFFNRAFHF